MEAAKQIFIVIFLTCILMLWGAAVCAATDEDLAKAAQNPVSDLISLPFQNNTFFETGFYEKTLNVTNIQPVIPFHLSNKWNIITRTIVPVISRPVMFPGESRTFGLSDTIFTAFLSPAKSEGLIWGIGPVVQLPTRTDAALGVNKWGLGPSAVILQMQGPWVYGAIVNNIWTEDTNMMTLQPFVNFNFPAGWYLSSSPIITANWKVESDNRWLVPVGGGVGKVFKIGKLPINCMAQGFYNVVRPEFGSRWILRLQVQLLFPKRK